MGTTVLERHTYARSLDAGADDAEYQPFPDVHSRNLWQERIELPALVRLLALPRGGRVLEVGCGQGVALPVLAARLRPSRLVGIDVDAGLLDRASERLRATGTSAELRQADLRRLPFTDGAFDLVFDFGTCYHVSRPAQALAEISRVLADGGLFVHETRLSQRLSHPVRSRGRSLPWHRAPHLARAGQALLWATRRKVGAALCGLLLLATAGTARAGAAGDGAVTPAPEPAVSSSEGAGETRLMLAPTARTPGRGDGYAGVTEIVFPFAEVGVSSRVSVLAYVTPPLEGLTSAGVVLVPKVQLLRRQRAQLAVGVLQPIGVGTFGGVGYAVATFGGRDSAVTAGVGYGYGDWESGSDSQRALVYVGAEKRLWTSLRLTAEAYLGGEGLGLPARTLLAGATLGRGVWTADVGFVLPIYQSGAGTPFPLLTVKRRF